MNKFTWSCAGMVALGWVGTGCGKKKESYDFGAPKVAEIVEAAAPKGLVSSGASLALAPSCGSFNPNNPVSGGWSAIDNFVSYLKCATFQKNPQVEGTAYYRYWVDVLDKAMSDTNTRLSEAADSLPACVTAAPTPMTFKFDVEKGTSSGTDQVSVTLKFNCFESQSTPTPGASQYMAFGKDETNFYLMYVTKDAAQLTSTGQGIRIVMAKADASGNEADIWMIGNSYQGGQGVVPTDKIATMVNRVVANKATGAFTYAIAESVIGLTKQSMFIKSDGSSFYFKGQTAQPSNGGMSVTDVVDSTGAISDFCYAASTVESKDLSACTGAGLDKLTSSFGLTEIPRSKAETTFFSDLKTAVNTISATDFGAAGVGQFSK